MQRGEVAHLQERRRVAHIVIEARLKDFQPPEEALHAINDHCNENKIKEGRIVSVQCAILTRLCKQNKNKHPHHETVWRET
jgi:hypothetical protein